ncbi:MAG: HepT-like ribonuclease domain-containing protein [Planctomycetota bacterium]|jgi:uncharacterized protein with HEPN domain
MQPETRKFLYDVCQACEALVKFTEGKNLDDYKADLLLRSGVERQLMIIGEALSQAGKIDPSLSESIGDIRQIINLRNVIVHGYAMVENETIWGILQEHVPKLREEVKTLLAT